MDSFSFKARFGLNLILECGEMIGSRTTKSRIAVSLNRLLEIRCFLPHTTVALEVHC